ncbi:MAG: hypothetical protein GY854_14350 [Deltaproteobacteria bacterium]|nr:hypothetical protein [Deltaproteobacteria bacterium]
MILVGLLPELDSRYKKVFSYLQDDLGKKNPTVDTVIGICCSTFEEKIKKWFRFSNTAPLVETETIHLFGEQNSAQDILLHKAIKVDDRIVDYLLDSNEIDKMVSDDVELCSSLVDAPMPFAGLSRNEGLLCSCIREHSVRDEGAIFSLDGDRGADKYRCALFACSKSNIGLLKVDTATIVGKEPGAFRIKVKHFTMEALLNNAALFFDDSEVLLEGEKDQRLLFLTKRLEENRIIGFLSTQKEWRLRTDLGAKKSEEDRFYGFRIPSWERTYEILNRDVIPPILPSAGAKTWTVDGIVNKEGSFSFVGIEHLPGTRFFFGVNDLRDPSFKIGTGIPRRASPNSPNQCKEEFVWFRRVSKHNRQVF